MGFWWVFDLDKFGELSTDERADWEDESTEEECRVNEPEPWKKLERAVAIDDA